ncbi:Glycoside hydrolase, family 31 [Kalmanozyma brasiliensis GHG001]|uniref:Putative Alpha-glucosidase n=1 Tax=Kalmanozyma brasiliensis (strain GHG001) TaxID=1365824 RepID=V5E5F5_KALBG|nr:Glycoside hydrolase, family 31 [Kalmanozyma brasiliensis GHG001]EST05446.1 Glycoside hydrolase, family 31 [Kalmanozyma brasiliensis GHG001]
MRPFKAASLTPLLALFATVSSTLALPSTVLDKQLEARNNAITPSFDVTSCPGYQLVGSPNYSDHGFTAQLSLAGTACNAYGVDIHNLTLSVVYEKKHTLHVHIYDTAKQQYQLPNGLIFDRASSNPANIQDGSTAEASDLIFHHTAENGTQSGSWAFWIARRSTGDVIFDTRSSNIPTYDNGMNNVSSDTKRNSTAMPKHELVFENQYLQLSSALPEDANIYGLGEYVTGSFRRNSDETLQPFFTLDAGTPVDSNMYGYHPVYLETRRGSDGRLASHSVSMLNTAGMDVLLRRGVVQYRAIGGTLDLRFTSGDYQVDGCVKNSPNTAIQQYVNFVGNPVLHPYWSFGFHLCRWGYNNVSDTQAIIDAMRENEIPLEVQWNDIDYLQSFRDFTVDPQRFPQSEFAQMISKLRENHQHYIPIIDMAIPKAPTNSSDTYYPGTRGDELDVFLHNRNGTEYIGEVWPGYTSFVDQQAKNAGQWWTEAIRNFSEIVDFSGIWLDMNEPSSFVIGNAAGAETNLSDTPAYTAATSVAGWPQGYNNLTWGKSGNITLNGSYTFQQGAVQNNDSPAQRRSLLPTFSREDGLVKRQTDDKFGPNTPDYRYANATQRYLSNPPYAIHNGIHNSESPLNINLDHKTVAMDAVSADGQLAFYDVHNLDGTLEEQHFYNALRSIRPNERPFLISRSTYPGAGKYTGHWLGDNYALWTILPGSEAYKAGAGMAQSIDGVLQFQIFGIHLIGADICGFNRNTDEELCNRWMMLGAFLPFMRNHNTIGAIAQEPFRWDSVANASRIAIRKRYEILPSLYSHMARASASGEPAVRAVWYEFDEVFEQTKDYAHQFLFGDDLLVSPTLEPNVTSIKALFPSAGGRWRNVFTWEALDVVPNKNVTVPAELSTINVHLRPGRALLTHTKPAYTVHETAQSPFGLVVNLNNDGWAKQHFYLDDGITPAPTDNSTLIVCAQDKSVSGSMDGAFRPNQTLENVVVLDVREKPETVMVGGEKVQWKWDGGRELLNVTGLQLDLGSQWNVSWS